MHAISIFLSLLVHSAMSQARPTGSDHNLEKAALGFGVAALAAKYLYDHRYKPGGQSSGQQHSHGYGQGTHDPPNYYEGNHNPHDYYQENQNPPNYYQENQNPHDYYQENQNPHNYYQENQENQYPQHHYEDNQENQYPQHHYEENQENQYPHHHYEENQADHHNADDTGDQSPGYLVSPDQSLILNHLNRPPTHHKYDPFAEDE
ncbi:hypothetical protein IWQ62_005681 [Dispira parvispora]|uniref:Uncharacterized protein n=1 Tax=Dispira parvispora TaxID=1520584 RepID=A0A9W8APZ3_9FUNG|nr:hypothetical protein IWQ62_005681 [Dispira parvispora]